MLRGPRSKQNNLINVDPGDLVVLHLDFNPAVVSDFYYLKTSLALITQGVRFPDFEKRRHRLSE